MHLGDSDQASDEESLDVYATVKNIGPYSGEYVAQVYGCPNMPDFPQRLLLGFNICDLNDGEEVTVHPPFLLPFLPYLTFATVQMRLEFEGQAYDCYQDWCRREAEAYHTVIKYLSPTVSAQVAGIGTSRELWNDLEELYQQTELATYCSIGDRTHIAILLTQIGSEYAFIVDAIQNDKEPGTPAAVGNRLANAERVVRGKDPASSPASSAASIHVITPVKKCRYCKRKGHDQSRCWKKHPHLRPQRDRLSHTDWSDSSAPSDSSYGSGQKEDRPGPPAFKRPRVNIVRAKVTTFYTHAPDPRWIVDSAATSHVCWDRECFTSLRQHREMLMTAGDPVEAEGIGTVKLRIRGKPHRTVVLKNVYYAPRVGINLISVPKLLRDHYSVVAHPRGIALQRRGRPVGSIQHTGDDLFVLHCQASCKPRVQVHLARNATVSVTSREPSDFVMADGDPLELSGAQSVVTTSELHSGNALVNLKEDASIGVDQETSEELWHARMGHLNRGDLRLVLRQSGTPYRPLTCQELQATPRCPACMAGKQHQKRHSRRRNPSIRSSEIFELVHSDLMEMPVGKDGSRYVVTFTDNYSRGSWSYAMKWKSEALQKFQFFEAWVRRQFGTRIKRFLCDNGREYLAIGTYLELQGMEFDTSAPYCKGQNGLAERTNRTIRERVNTLLYDTKLPLSFWTEILDTVVYLKLRAPASFLQKKTPYEVLYGKLPSLSHLRRIGSHTWVLIPKEQRPKLGPRSSECRLLGYSEPNQYKLYEGEVGNGLPGNDPPSLDLPNIPVAAVDLSPPKPISIAIPSIALPPQPPPEADEPEVGGSTHDTASSETTNPVASEVQDIPDLGYSLFGRRRQPSRRLLEAIGKVYFTLPLSSSDRDPQTFQEAVSGPHRVDWWASIQKEYSSLLENGTWDKIMRKDVPPGHRVIECKWVFKTKANGVRKSRLVIKGFRQRTGVNYHETFAAVSRMDSVRCIVASAILKGWELHQFDAVIAFLHGDIDTDIYMELPEGFQEEGYVCRLRQSLYGLKQAPRIWYRCVRRVLKAHGFFMAQSDNCVFYKENCVVCVYVDDFLVAGANDREIYLVRNALESKFKLNDLGTLRSFLGIQFVIHDDGSVSLHQRQYIQKILSDFCMETCQPKDTPMIPKSSLDLRPDERSLDDTAGARYSSAIGALMYLMIGTRPDIAFAVATLSRFVSRPQSHHQAALQRLLRYLEASQDVCISYRKGDLIGYTDADFGGSVVTDGAYSTSGYIFKLAGGPISWSSKKQGEIATSTTHAEYIGQYNAILHLQRLRTFLDETNLYWLPVTHIMADNQSAIALSRNPEFHKRAKHFNAKFHY
ncbi:retrovirus-related Pol polyprotein from transposon TNT 1-94 [Aspergillus affinis]|uniref:retrovirus-related Pol polyprotein from transposon TNT 1-94 n=1 Tax=Aspergillus affinis TaxID=1070780 RepID=UPI0022FE3C5D|nr:retrovirus-related Pol polyprotein from transposon TNT 1-94 [Aspergillus affinis]KAI9037532.1 retrovirus-related Pol polyprotein from transposon TNT 1-94 [Aspergillus affinis]